jgi:hypothetical protein
VEWQQRCLYFFLISQFLFNYGINSHILSKSRIENLIGNQLSSLFSKFEDYLLVSNSVATLNYDIQQVIEKLQTHLDFSRDLTFIFASRYSEFMKVYSLSFFKSISVPVGGNKRKRSGERLQDSDSDKSPMKPAGNVKKKTMAAVSPTHLLFNNGAFNTESESEEIQVLRRLNGLMEVRFFCNQGSVAVSQAELEFFSNILKNEQFYANESVVKFYIEFARWISITGEVLPSQMVQECLSIMSYVLNLSFLSKNHWILSYTLKIMCHILPYIDQSSNEILELFKKLITAFTLLLRGKSSFRTSDDICVPWRVSLRYLELYLRCAALNKEKIVFNDSNILESSGLLYMAAWNHHQFEMRMLSPLHLSLAKENQISDEFSRVNENCDIDSIMFFISTVWFYSSVVASSSFMRLSATIKLLELVGSDYRTYFISNLLDDNAYKLGFTSCDTYLLDLVDQRLLFRWKHDIEELPFLLFGFESLIDFLSHNLERSLPKIIYDSKWDLLSQILSSSPSASIIIRRNLSCIFVELALDHKSLDELVKIINLLLD